MRVSLCLAKENEDCAVLEKTAWVYIERLDIVICHQPLRAFPPWARGGHPLPEVAGGKANRACLGKDRRFGARTRSRYSGSAGPSGTSSMSLSDRTPRSVSCKDPPDVTGLVAVTKLSDCCHDGLERGGDWPVRLLAHSSNQAGLREFFSCAVLPFGDGAGVKHIARRSPGPRPEFNADSLFGPASKFWGARRLSR